MIENNDYEWVIFFKELGDKLLEYETRQKDLISILIDKCGIDKGLTDINEKNEPFELEEIDPFSFIATFCKFGPERRAKYLKIIKDKLKLNSNTPTKFNGVPNASGFNTWLFPYKADRKIDHIEKLWNLFKNVKTQSQDKIEILFNDLLQNYSYVGNASLTQAMFRVDPENYFPIDAQTRPYLKNLGIHSEFTDFQSYRLIIKSLKAIKGNELYELSRIAWEQNNDMVEASYRSVLCFYDGKKTHTLLSTHVEELFKKLNIERFNTNYDDNFKLSNLYDFALFFHALDIDEENKILDMIRKLKDMNRKLKEKENKFKIFIPKEKFSIPIAAMSKDKMSSIEKNRMELEERYGEQILKFGDIEELRNLITSILTETPEKKEIKLESMSIRNISLFDEADIVFHKNITVFIGLNGTGKTTILRAIALALTGYNKQEDEKEGFEKLKETIIRLSRIEGIRDENTIYSNTSEISLQIKDYSEPRMITVSQKEPPLKPIIESKNKDHIEDEMFFQNLVIGFSQNRTFSSKDKNDSSDTTNRPNKTDLLNLIYNEPEDKLSSFQSWIVNNHKKTDLIETVFKIISSFTGDKVSFYRIESYDPPKIWIKTEETPNGIPLSLMSQGYHSLIGWVGYILQRMYSLNNDDANNFTNQPAVVLIDEIDTYIHPKWQSNIIPALEEFFTNTQFVITTHSPIIVQYLKDPESLYILKRDEISNKIECIQKERKSYASLINNILHDYFLLLNERPKDISEKFQKIKNLIDDNKLESAEEILKELKNEINYSDSEIQFNESMIQNKRYFM